MKWKSFEGVQQIVFSSTIPEIFVNSDALLRIWVYNWLTNDNSKDVYIFRIIISFFIFLFFWFCFVFVFFF